jgi:hypothetical protein
MTVKRLLIIWSIVFLAIFLCVILDKKDTAAFKGEVMRQEVHFQEVHFQEVHFFDQNGDANCTLKQSDSGIYCGRLEVIPPNESDICLY